MKQEYIPQITGAVAIVSLLVFLFYLLPEYQEGITAYTIAHPVLAPAILVLWRFIGVVIPPIPAGILAIGLLPLMGWVWVFFYSSLGLLSGAVVAFLLARHFREPLVKRFVPFQDLNKWEAKVSEKNELSAFIFLRLVTGPVMDFISYLAGLTKLPFWKFFVATVISLIPSALGYYVSATAYDHLSQESPGMVIGTLVLLAIGYFSYKYYTKYHKKKK